MIAEVTDSGECLAAYDAAAGESGAPAVWDADRNELMPTKCADDALGGFDLVLRRHDRAKPGEYRTRRLILEPCDKMTV